MLHYFPEDFSFEIHDSFTDPSRYIPHESVKFAAAATINQIDSHPELAAVFSEGKMLGVLVCSTPDKSLAYLAGFSGNVGGKSIIEGFVPPIFDLMNPDGEFKRREAEITEINKEIQRVSEDGHLEDIKRELFEAEHFKEAEICQMKKLMDASRNERELLRKTSEDPVLHERLVRQSQHEKAELHRLKKSWNDKIDIIRLRLEDLQKSIVSLKKRRAEMSEALQDWIFSQYIVHNAQGESASIAGIFAASGLTPPGGTGECAAPKLLEYAYRNKLTPLAMGEFWYGKSPETAVRTHGRFYPSCTSKCGPLLGYMLKGLKIESIDSMLSESLTVPIIIFEDNDLIVVEKPSGMPSVPGLDGKQSLQEWLKARHMAKNPCSGDEIHAVHRLDMDTSGIMLYAKSHNSAVCLRKQFEEHTVKKTYMARLCPAETDSQRTLKTNQTGFIDLPLSADYDERPRQKVDINQGKPAHTEFKVSSINPDGTTDILLYPHTGRTHQLRVHCSHCMGLSRPIIGDLLYGGHNIGNKYATDSTRLHLHAFSITFNHPVTGQTLTFEASTLCFVQS